MTKVQVLIYGDKVEDSSKIVTIIPGATCILKINGRVAQTVQEFKHACVDGRHELIIEVIPSISNLIWLKGFGKIIGSKIGISQILSTTFQFQAESVEYLVGEEIYRQEETTEAFLSHLGEMGIALEKEDFQA